MQYSKGASVLRMLSNMIGEETFLKGVSIYLKKHLYGNASTLDLWAGISEASGLDIAKIMASWTLKIGFPVIKVEETSGGIKVTQNRYLSQSTFPSASTHEANDFAQALATQSQRRMRRSGMSRLSSRLWTSPASLASTTRRSWKSVLPSSRSAIPQTASTS